MEEGQHSKKVKPDHTRSILFKTVASVCVGQFTGLMALEGGALFSKAAKNASNDKLGQLVAQIVGGGMTGYFTLRELLKHDKELKNNANKNI